MHLLPKYVLVVTLLSLCWILGCGDTEDPLQPLDATDKYFSTIAETKIPPFTGAPAAPQAPATDGIPAVTSVSYYADWKLTKPITGTIAPGTTLFTQIVFSEPMTFKAAADKTARPILYYRIDGKLTRYRIAKHGASGEAFQSGDAKPRGKGTHTFLCKYTLPDTATGTFTTAVGKLNTDKQGNTLAKFYSHPDKLQIGTPTEMPAPMPAGTSAPKVTEVGFYSDVRLTRPLRGEVPLGETIYTKVVFSHPMVYVPGRGAAARPVLAFRVDEKQTQYRVVKSGKFGSGDCKPKGRDLTTWLCKWTSRDVAGGVFTVGVGAESVDAAGVRLSEAYLHKPGLQLGSGEMRLSNSKLSENSAVGSRIGVLTHKGTASPTYWIVNGEAAGLFSVDAAGVLRSKVVFDYEAVSVHSVVVGEVRTGSRARFQVQDSGCQRGSDGCVAIGNDVL